MVGAFQASGRGNEFGESTRKNRSVARWLDRWAVDWNHMRTRQHMPSRHARRLPNPKRYRKRERRSKDNVFRLDFQVAPHEDARSLDHIAQLPNVSRPSVLVQNRESICAQEASWSEPSGKARRQRGYVIEAVA